MKSLTLSEIRKKIVWAKNNPIKAGELGRILKKWQKEELAMSDKIKGYLIVLDKEYGQDYAKLILKAIEMIKGVRKVTPYVAGAEDLIAYQNGFMDCKMKILEKMRED